MSARIELTASGFARIVGADRHELAKKLEALKAKPTGRKNGGALYGLRDLVQAHVGGDERQERIRKLRAESRRLELQNAKSEGELVEVALVKRHGAKVMAAIRATIMTSALDDAAKRKCLEDLAALKNADFSK